MSNGIEQTWDERESRSRARCESARRTDETAPRDRRPGVFAGVDGGNSRAVVPLGGQKLLRRVGFKNESGTVRVESECVAVNSVGRATTKDPQELRFLRVGRTTHEGGLQVRDRQRLPIHCIRCTSGIGMGRKLQAMTRPGGKSGIGRSGGERYGVVGSSGERISPDMSRVVLFYEGC